MKIDNPFAGLTNPDDIRSAFKAAALRYHPDITGDDGEKFKLMLNMYHDALSGQHGQTFTRHDDQKEWTYHYNAPRETALSDKISEVVASGLASVLEVFTVGSWLWIMGDTKPHSKKLGKNGLKMRWHSKRNAWYWHNPTKRRTKYNSRLSLSDLADKYGSETVHGSTAVST